MRQDAAPLLLHVLLVDGHAGPGTPSTADLAVDLAGAWGALSARRCLAGQPCPWDTREGKTHSVGIVTAFSPWDGSCKSFPGEVTGVGLLKVAADH